MKKVLVIAGPTAVGKTSLSIELAKKLNGEIISGDSMQVYKDLDIGTAKVTKEERVGIRHHLIDCRDLSETYSVADFQKEGRQAIDSITAKGKLPIVVGGTGLYVQALLYDFELGAKDESTEIREKYEQFAETHGNQRLWELLQEKDNQAAESIHFNNRKKVIRALEVFDKTGFSILTPKEKPKKLYDYFLVGLETDRAVLYDRINMRVDIMMTQGLLIEAELLYKRQTKQSIQGIGYKEFFPYFEGKETLDEAIEQVKQNSRRYAKRQLTWFRNRMNASWWDLVQAPDTMLTLEQDIEDWLET
ncbi:tRNA (adenosine(37)-N6)-dimethylallyltransferase MiaA [Enterococcus ureasiticus]|uniref:tRNA (adenosine(37)-N6)-dimethylallyltransferase MiaA n=1 Tax=Enterococcus TaxID=1350 RepID=UPI001A8BFA5C|nr:MULTISPECIES: tRNA (adenosine(37)-N6)-dimethylallyltransferase MiaA [Enterococcus]MBO0434264.1 tRNA (adenosine(37)-N6)-dimethylallyltransferase MiaA [Enterococcus sp. DIV0849a]MBO0473573.1 tRNA (adenosine(37)-N6)-dimethylallyltransferase MiaA [Enterococcus ureasiticus]